MAKPERLYPPSHGIQLRATPMERRPGNNRNGPINSPSLAVAKVPASRA